MTTHERIWKIVHVPIPKIILDAIVVTTVSLIPNDKPNKSTEIIMIDVTGLKLGSACKATLEAILTAERIPIKHISLVLLFSVDIIPDDCVSCFYFIGSCPNIRWCAIYFIHPSRTGSMIKFL